MGWNFIVNVVRTAAALAAGAMIGTTPVVFAQEGENLIDLSKLVFYRGAAYSVTYESEVSTTALAMAQVRKIGYGRTTVVNIVTTASGVYSSDAMISPHVLYPGVHVERLPEAADDSEGSLQYPPRLAYWSNSRGWVATPFVTAGSFAVVSRTPMGVVVTTDETTCVLTATVARC